MAIGISDGRPIELGPVAKVDLELMLQAERAKVAELEQRIEEMWVHAQHLAGKLSGAVSGREMAERATENIARLTRQLTEKCDDQAVELDRLREENAGLELRLAAIRLVLDD